MSAGLYTQAITVTPSDTVGFVSGSSNGLYVGVSGDVTGVVAGAVVLFKAVPVGLLHVSFSRINATATTATNMLALY